MTAFLAIDEVSVAYGPVAVLHGITIGVARGEFVALLGASGCGKTTLLRAVAGFVRVQAGRIRIDGRNIAPLPPERRGIAMVFQSYALWPHMTASQNIGYGLRLRRMRRAEIRERVKGMLTLLGLEGLGDRTVKQLSGGQQQRVALGRALAVDPTLLLLDEPLSNLDAGIRQQVRHEIKALQRTVGITAIMVTHDREEAMVMADRIVVMNEGVVAQTGTPEEIFNRPASPFVAGFMGAGNVVDLEVEPDDGGIRVRPGPGHDAVRLRPRAALNGGGRATAHFRSEAASLLPSGGTAPEGCLVLRGEVAQASYPGGVYRYAVTVAGQLYLVDDARRFDVGATVGVCLPGEALHLFPTQAN